MVSFLIIFIYLKSLKTHSASFAEHIRDSVLNINLYYKKYFTQ